MKRPRFWLEVALVIVLAPPVVSAFIYWFGWCLVHIAQAKP